jgi:1,2-dihydroxy-3-keto-5-methylthiopentene dioxygenase
MSLLVVWPDEHPAAALRRMQDPEAIVAALREIGCRFEHRPVRPEVGPDSDQDAVLAAYRDEVDELTGEYGFGSVDVAVSYPSDEPGWAAQAAQLRAQFASEHTHGDAEVRYVVRGSGVFYLHAGGTVNALRAMAGDLIAVPAKTAHWFDMGPRPDFTTIRFFPDAQGWVGYPTGSDIASRIPDADAVHALALESS